MIEALDTNKKMDFKSIFNREQEATRIGKLHGKDRAKSSNYDLTEVIFEYHILREVIFQVLESDGPIQAIQRDIILDSIEQAVNDAAVEFSEITTDIQQKFVDTLTHDLKNPIAAAKMNAELILRRSEIPATSFNFVKRIIGSMNRLETMIHDLLDASRIRAGEELSLQFINCNLEKVIQDVMDEMTITHGERFVFDSIGPIEGKFGCDGIRRAVENLVGNAVKYSKPLTQITVSIRKDKKFAEIKVHNQGTPISEKELPLLFQHHRRTQSAHEGTKTGWGLGLTLVKGVVDAHAGQVKVESAEGKGTSFILILPITE